MRILRDSCIACIKFYRWAVAPIFISLGVRCRFHPSCSAYAVEALQVHGLGKGIRLSFWRLLRCHPLCEGGHDPVPRLRSFGRRNG